MKLCRHMLFGVKTFILMRKCQKYTAIILLVTQFYPIQLISGQFHPKRWNYADICCLAWRHSYLCENVRNIWIYLEDLKITTFSWFLASSPKKDEIMQTYSMWCEDFLIYGKTSKNIQIYLYMIKYMQFIWTHGKKLFSLFFKHSVVAAQNVP